MAMVKSSTVEDFGQDSIWLPKEWKPEGLPWGEGKTFLAQSTTVGT